jgi:putative transposase
MKLKHYDHDGRARFVTFCTHQRIPALTNDVFRAEIVSAISAAQETHRMSLVAYVIMPEHVHLVLVLDEDTKLGTMVGDIKRLSSRVIHEWLVRSNSAILGKLTVTRDGVRRFALWQRRCYDHNVRSEESLCSKVEYCHNNPVARRLVRRAEDWRWSSCQFYAGVSEVPLKMDGIVARDISAE